MTVYQKLRYIHNEAILALETVGEKEFVDDVYDALTGVPSSINDADIDEYLSARQVKWINDIYERLT